MSRAVNCERFELDCFNNLLIIPRWSSLMNRVFFSSFVFSVKFFIDNSMKVIYFSALVGQHKKH